MHLRRGDYYQHCVKVRKGSVKEWVTFQRTPHSSIFAGSRGQSAGGGPGAVKLDPTPDPFATRFNQSIAGCYPSLVDIERAFDAVAAATGITNIFVATNTPEDLIAAGIVEPFTAPTARGGGVDGVAAGASTRRRRASGRKWTARCLPRNSSSVVLQRPRGVDDVVLDMAALSLGRYFVLNRFSSFSAIALEMAIVHRHAHQDPSRWDNVVTW